MNSHKNYSHCLTIKESDQVSVGKVYTLTEKTPYNSNESFSEESLSYYNTEEQKEGYF